jgi:hypothetical protein
MTDDYSKKLEIRNQHYRRSGFDEKSKDYKDLRTFFDALLGYFEPGEWESRKRKIKDEIKKKDQDDLNQSSIFETLRDRIGLYLVLAELTMDDPMCGDSSQAAKLLPIMFGIGRVWHKKNHVANLDKKMVEIIRKYRNDPDGLLFEVLVALNYANRGWQVQMLFAEASEKTPDLYVQSGKNKFFVECKRQSRQSTYSINEGIYFNKMWKIAQNAMAKHNLKHCWLDIVFHVEICELPEDFLETKIKDGYFSKFGSFVISDSNEVTIRCRRIDYSKIIAYMSENKLKNNRSLLRHLIGQNWAGLNSRGTLDISADYSNLLWCESGTASQYIDSIYSALGSTFECNAPESIEARARDVKKLLAAAVTQVPNDKKSIIHIMVESTEGFDVDSLRNEKMYEMFRAFKFEKMIDTISLNSVRCNDVTELVLDINETIQTWVVPEFPVLNIPRLMMLPPENPVVDGLHWSNQMQ